MSLIYKINSHRSSKTQFIRDYLGEISPFAKRINKVYLLIPLILLKSIEWSIYRWYKTPIRRFYGVKGNELIYMITRRCNEKCAKCGIWKNPEADSDRIPIIDFINCLRKLHHNLYQITLTGGEPLLFMDEVLIIAEEANKLNVPMIIVTNGSLVTENFLKKYSNYGHTLVVSLDTLEKDKWLSFRGRNSYETVMDNILLASKILKGKLRVQSVFAYETQEDIPNIKAFCDKLGIQHTIQPYMDFGGVWHDAIKSSHHDNDGACAARKNICIYNNGDVVKCFDHHRIPLAKEPLGNISKDDIISILCKKRSTEITKIMKTCNFPCKHLSCNIPTPPFVLRQ
jgi:MoaA/NifB/PqqE/SkfB family radical SAM enzyme